MAATMKLVHTKKGKKKKTKVIGTENIFCRSDCICTHNLKQTDRVKNYILGLKLHRKFFCRAESDTHNLKQENRVKTTWVEWKRWDRDGPGSVHLHCWICAVKRYSSIWTRKGTVVCELNWKKTGATGLKIEYCDNSGLCPTKLNCL
jgi:hypothetical protein